MELTLFDFDFSQENDEQYSEEKIKEMFAIVQEYSKQKGNGYYLSIESLPRNVLPYIDTFLESGWIERRGSGINIKDTFLLYHTVDEIIEEFRQCMEAAFKTDKMLWYKDVLPIINYSIRVVRFRSEQEKKECYQKKEKVIKDYAMRLGLQYFKENQCPDAVGYKTTTFSKKSFFYKNVLPTIVSDVKRLSTYEEVETYFKDRIFFIGRNDGDKKFKLPPFPEYKAFVPHYLLTACLAEAEEEQDIIMLLEYCGQCLYGNQDSLYHKAVYPKGWSFERYYATLTDEDKRVLMEERERLMGLHGRDIFKGHLLFQMIEEEKEMGSISA